MKDNLGDRLKSNYEDRFDHSLPRRMPTVIRLDGKSFHTFTKGFKRPWDDLLIEAIDQTAAHLCKEVMNCVISYQQSDEISLLLIDYKNQTSKTFFDNSIQKLCSVTAGMASAFFTRWMLNFIPDCSPVVFDSRCFVLPEFEVSNYFLWRQQDAIRNSIQSLGQYHLSHKSLQGKSCADIQDMLFRKKDINWHELPTRYKRGRCCIKESYEHSERIVLKTLRGYVDETATTTKTRWVVDNEIPIFSTDRNYIEKYIPIWNRELSY